MKLKLDYKFLNILSFKYFNKINIKGQTSIELIVLIFIISTIIFSASNLFFPRVASLLDNQKVVWINKIAKTAKVYRSDFEPISISIADDSSTSERARERKRRQDTARKRSGKTEGVGASSTTSPGGTTGTGTGEDATEASRRRREVALEQERLQREQERSARRQRIDSLDSNDPAQRLEKERLEKAELEDLSSEEQDRVSLARRFETEEDRKTSIFSSQHSNFWKFIIILVIVVFFIIIFFKSRSKKD